MFKGHILRLLREFDFGTGEPTDKKNPQGLMP